MLRIFKTKFADFQEFNFFLQNQKPLKKILSFINLPYGRSRDIPQKFGPDRFSRFDVYWMQDNPNLYIDEFCLIEYS